MVDCLVTATVIASAGTPGVGVGIGEDSTTAADANCIIDLTTNATTVINNPQARLIKVPAVGYHYWAWLESGDSGTMTWYGVRASGAGTTQLQNGMLGYIEA